MIFNRVTSYRLVLAFKTVFTIDTTELMLMCELSAFHERFLRSLKYREEIVSSNYSTVKPPLNCIGLSMTMLKAGKSTTLWKKTSFTQIYFIFFLSFKVKK